VPCLMFGFLNPEWLPSSDHDVSEESKAEVSYRARSGPLQRRYHFPKRSFALSVTSARSTLPETSSPYPPSSTTWNQHEVMPSIDALCACTPCWTYTVRIGVEPIRAAHARPVGLAPPRGCARLPRHRLPARLSLEDWFSSLPPGCEYPAHATL
jgi:hypothetical protein